jgi:tRNA(adenine34) deaminase
MQMALAEARKAQAIGEVPVGAVVVAADSIILGLGFNRPISDRDPTAHAEIVALREAAMRTGNYRLTGATLYCTKEPCLMCAGAMIHARIERLVYGAKDLKAGAAGSIYNVLRDPRLNHRVDIVSGIREPDCRLLLQTFFTNRRNDEGRK